MRDETTSRSPFRQAVSYGAYPVVVGGTLWLHHALSVQGTSDSLAQYGPALFAALAITLLEQFIPYRREWRPSAREVGDDALFMAGVQVLWPKALYILLSWTFLDFLATQFEPLVSLWPRHWPVAVQVVVMILLADFLRYGLHRLAHEWPPLWRLHAVHHSPHRLYWVNVGRFHPLEKALQLAFDSLPFLLLGLPKEVLAWYFVFYSVNGFFQHSNVDVKLGPLNHIISGPELHRWHHSVQVSESNRNYGNNVIVWDHLFGSRFLPEGREVERLGLKNKAYPLTFLEQMTTPFNVDPGGEEE